MFQLQIFSARQVQLEDARARAHEEIERQLVTEEIARELNLIDFLAAGFAEAERQFRNLSHEDRFEALVRQRRQTPQEYGRDMAPFFVDILKQLAGVAPGQGLRPDLLG